jgi:succinate-semialdehyde dehydrogenase/glutarate-semialdehyde dehydrogenase
MSLDVVDPRTGRVVDDVALLAEAGVTRVTGQAADAFGPWSATPVARRRALLLGMAEALAKERDEVAAGYSRQHGKLPHEAEVELDRAVETIEWFADAAERLLAPRSLPGRSGFGRREVHVDPVGPVLAIVPWNYAAVILARKIAPALAMGCPVIVKGPEQTPGVTKAFMRAAEQAGIPSGVLQVVFAEPPVVAGLVRAPAVRQVSFTGSTRVGRIIAGLAAESLTPCVLELGGHAPVIVTEDADLVDAVPTIVAAKAASTGQSCGSPSRVLVHRSRHDEFVDRCAAAAADVVMGPLSSAARRIAVHELVVDARDRGAAVRCGGEIPPGPGFHYPMTVLTDVPPEARVLAEEPFGPVLPVVAYVEESDAVREANGNDFALSAYVFGEPAHAERIACRVDAGSVSVNVVPTAFPDAPLGGRRASGYGYEGGDAGLLAFGRLRILQTRGKRV